MARSPKRAFTPFWASSKFPRMPSTDTLPPRWVVIWRFCIRLTPSSG